MPFIQYDYVGQAIPAYRSDDSFHEWILPGTFSYGDDFLDLHSLYSSSEMALSR